MSFRHQGQELLTSSEGENLLLWDSQLGGLLATLEGHGAGRIHLASAPNSSSLISAARDGTLLFWRDHKPQPFHWQDAHIGEILDLEWSPKTLASCGEDGWIKLWNPVNGDFLGHIHPASPPLALCFLNRGRLLAGALKSGAVHVWETSTQKLVRTLTGHQGFVLGLVAAPGKKWLASGGADGQLLFWDWSTGSMLARHQTFQGRLHCIAASQDGRLVASGGEDQTILLWRGPR
jgi:WD40 repeat protein